MKTSKAKTTRKPKENSKAKAIGKPKKTSGIGKAVKGRKSISVQTVLSEEVIRKKANEIYLERIARGEHGTATDDWQKAEKLLRGF